MWNYLNTRNGIARIKIAIKRWLPYIIEDLRCGILNQIGDLFRLIGIHAEIKNIAVKVGIVKVQKSTSPPLPAKPVAQELTAPVKKPLIFVSYCAGAYLPGSLKFSGGTKELNYLVKLLRKHGYEAYTVTYDGCYEPWLLDHQPHISMNQFSHMISEAPNVRCVTSWADATAFIQASPSIYFWDMELAYTESHFSILAKLYSQKLRNTACITRTIQAWHMANFQRSCTLLPNLLDDSLWSPLPAQRQSRRIGYMNEGPHTEAYLALVRDVVQENKLNLEFQLIKGIETDVLAGMRSCSVFLSMNIGKDSLWGEGCPRTVIEALATGCVVIAFDIIGNREIIQDNFNSILVPRYCPDLMAAALVRLYTHCGEIDRLRTNALALLQACHTFDARWPAVENFLHL